MRVKNILFQKVSGHPPNTSSRDTFMLQRETKILTTSVCFCKRHNKAERPTGNQPVLHRRIASRIGFLDLHLLYHHGMYVRKGKSAGQVVPFENNSPKTLLNEMQA